MKPLLLSIFLTFSLPNPSSSSCFVEDSTFISTSLTETIPNTASALACQSHCASTVGCSHFTWYKPEAPAIGMICFLYSNPPSTDVCSNCVSGPKSCSSLCSAQFACVVEDNLLDIATSIMNETQCQRLCVGSQMCRFYTWYTQNAHPLPFVCFMFSNCGKQDFSVADCRSGPADCDDIHILPTTQSATTTTRKTTTTKTTTVKTTPTTTKADPPTTSPESYPSCYRKDITWATKDMIGAPRQADTFHKCQEVCKQNTKCGCSHFSWLPRNKLCMLYDRPDEEVECTSPCVSGPIDCALPVATTVDPSLPGCPYPQDPCKGKWHCPTDSPDSNLQVEHACYLTCYEGMYGGYIVCMEDGTYDKSHYHGC